MKDLKNYLSLRKINNECISKNCKRVSDIVFFNFVFGFVWDKVLVLDELFWCIMVVFKFVYLNVGVLVCIWYGDL